MLILGNMWEHVFSQLKETLSFLFVLLSLSQEKGHLAPHSKLVGWGFQEGGVSLSPLGANFQVGHITHVSVSVGVERWLPYLLDDSHTWRSLQGEVAQTLGAPLLSSHSIKGRALSLVEGGKYCKDTLLELLWNIFWIKGFGGSLKGSFGVACL